MKNFMLSLLGCALSFQCFASSMSELDGKLYVAPGSVGIYIQDLEGRIMKCLRCGEVHDSREKCRNAK